MDPSTGQAVPAALGIAVVLVGLQLHPPVDRHMVDLDPAFGDQLFDIALEEQDGRPAQRLRASRPSWIYGWTVSR